jgi:hypothetical protein
VFPYYWLIEGLNLKIEFCKKYLTFFLTHLTFQPKNFSISLKLTELGLEAWTVTWKGVKIPVFHWFLHLQSLSSLRFEGRATPFGPWTPLVVPFKKLLKLPLLPATVWEHIWKVQVYSLQKNALSKSVSKRSENHPDPHALFSRTNRSLDSAHILPSWIARNHFWALGPPNSLTVSPGSWYRKNVYMGLYNMGIHLHFIFFLFHFHFYELPFEIWNLLSYTLP